MTGKAKPEPEYYGRPTLKERGWTDALIARFLTEPDATAPNPHYRSGPPRKLYRIARVEEIERSTAFAVAKARTAPRKRAAARAVETKRAAMERHVRAVEFRVPALDRDELVRRACDHYNRRQAERAERRGWCDYDPATPHSSPAFLGRICVNYLRHAMTDYDEHLDAVAGRVGVSTAYQGIVAKVLDAIAETYPWLAEECAKQKEARAGNPASP